MIDSSSSNAVQLKSRDIDQSQTKFHADNPPAPSSSSEVLLNNDKV